MAPAPLVINAGCNIGENFVIKAMLYFRFKIRGDPCKFHSW